MMVQITGTKTEKDFLDSSSYNSLANGIDNMPLLPETGVDQGQESRQVPCEVTRNLGETWTTLPYSEVGIYIPSEADELQLLLPLC